MRVIPTFDEFENRLPSLGMIPQGAALNELTFECGEKALLHGVIIAVADRAIDVAIPASRQRSLKAHDVYCAP